jgi:hypothetical protein
MKKNSLISLFWLPFLFLLMAHYSKAQNRNYKAQECNYEELIREADSLSKNDYEKAINKLNSARACKPEMATEVDAKIKALFDRINNERIKAQNNEKKLRVMNASLSASYNEIAKQFKGGKLGVKDIQAMSPQVRKALQQQSSEINAAILNAQAETENAAKKVKKEIINNSGSSASKNTFTKANGTGSLQAGTGKTVESIHLINREKYRKESKKIFDEIFITLDLLNRTKPSIKNNAFAKEDVVYSLDGKLRDSIAPDSQQFNKISYTESSQKIAASIKNGDSVNEYLLFEYLRSAYYYSWNLMNIEQYDKAKPIIDQADKIILQNKQSSTQIYHALSGIENAKRRFESHYGNNEASYEHGKMALEYANKTVSAEPHNISYVRNLMICVRNMGSSVSDSLLSKEEKANYSKLGCDFASYIDKIDGRGVALVVTFDCISEEVRSLIDSNRYDEAQTTLNSSISEFNKFIELNPTNYSKYLLRSQLYLSLANIRSRLKDTAGRKENTEYALKDWISYINGNKISPYDLEDFKSIYNDIVTNYNDVYTGPELDKRYKGISSVLDKIKPIYTKQIQIAQIIILLNNYIGDDLVANYNKADSTEALFYYSKSIASFESSNIINSYTGYSEDFITFCRSYSRRIALGISLKKEETIASDYNKIVQIFVPIYKKYPYDFYLDQNLAKAYNLYGQYLYDKGKYDKAILPLERASFEGIKNSTNYLIKIYNTKGYADTAKLSFYTLRARFQVDGAERFTFPADYNGVKQNFDVYILDRAKGYPYKGIEDQAEWLLKVRHGVISKDVVDAFNKIQDIAWDNNLSFKDLSIYAFDSENDKKILSKYAKRREAIEAEKNLTNKIILSDSLYKTYETDLQSATVNRKVIKNDAVTFYLKYARLLLENKDELHAKNLYRRILELEPENKEANKALKEKSARSLYENSKDFKALINTTDIDDLEFYLGYYLDNGDAKKADLIVKQILKIKDNAEVREEISLVYFDKNMNGDIQRLFLSNANRIKEFRDYFSNKNITDETNIRKREHYITLVELDKEFVKSNNSLATRITVANHYNSLGWYSILSHKFDMLIFYFNESIKYNPDYKYPRENLAHAYLFNDQFEKAKSTYMELKDQEFDKAAGYTTYKDAFLSDFKDFEKVGLTNDNIKEIATLLNQ